MSGVLGIGAFDVLEGEAEILKIPDSVNEGELDIRIVALPRIGVDIGRLQQADFVIVPQGLDRDSQNL